MADIQLSTETYKQSKKALRNVVFFIFFFLVLEPLSAQKNDYTITVTVDGIEKIYGNLVVTVYDKAKFFTQDTGEYCTKTVPVDSKTVTCIFKVPEGTYAIALYHDENDNNICDRNFLGIPREGFGFSNNIKPYFSAPSFQKCKFSVSQNTEIHITLLHY